MSNFKLLLANLMLLSFALAGCASKGPKTSVLELQQYEAAHPGYIQQMVEQKAQVYREMDNSALLKKLVEQSKAQREPFNSLAFRELRGRKDVKTDQLINLIHELKNGDALLPLILLRKLDTNAYREVPAKLRGEVLTGALQHSRMFNTWGLPGLYLEDASKAMLECDESAFPALKRMLSETRPAPVFGSKERMQNLRYQFRLCDYALFFLKKMKGDVNFEMPLSVTDRDIMIKSFLGS